MKNKIITIMLALVIFFSSLTNVSAKTLTIEEIDVQFKKIFKDSFGVNMTTEIDKVNHKYLITGNEEIENASAEIVPVTFTIGDEYIEFSDNSNISNLVNDPQKMMEAFGNELIVFAILQGAIEASGYTDKTVAVTEDGAEEFMNIFSSEDAYSTYGLFISTQHYEYHQEENGSSTNVSLEYLRHFKLSLDTTKIDALIAKYGVDKPKDSFEGELIDKFPVEEVTKPTEEVKEEAKEEKHYENPETGAFMPNSMIIGLSVIAAVVIILARRYSSFRRI